MDRASTDLSRPWAIIEIADGSDVRKRTELIRVAYRSSRAGVVALALRGVSGQVVDQALGSVVDIRSSSVRGVVYIDTDETREDLYAAARRAAVLIASSVGIRNELLRHEIDALDADDGTRVLLLTSEPR